TDERACLSVSLSEHHPLSCIILLYSLEGLHTPHDEEFSPCNVNEEFVVPHVHLCYPPSKGGMGVYKFHDNHLPLEVHQSFLVGVKLHPSTPPRTPRILWYSSSVTRPSLYMSSSSCKTVLRCVLPCFALVRSIRALTVLSSYSSLLSSVSPT